MIGQVTDIIKTYDGRFRLTLEVDSVDELNGLQGDIQIDVKKVSQKRSLNANAYFHVLVGKIVEKLEISKAKAKNILLGKYGQREILPTGQLIISIRSDIDMSEREDIHTVPIGYGQAKGHDFVHYAVIRGSHTYDNLEMKALLDGTVEDAKELGIPTMTPDEIARMEALWNQS